MSKSLDELVDASHSAWPLVQGWLAGATKDVIVLETDRPRGESTLLRLQVTTRSPMGALALESGGLLLDHGWVRVLGAGNETVTADLAGWNGPGGVSLDPRPEGYLVVGHDAVGGFFAADGGSLGAPGVIHYFAPSSLAWESLDMGYSQWLQWLCVGDLNTFYATERWPGWEAEVEVLSLDEGISIYPFLWAEAGPISERSRRGVPMRELWTVNFDMACQLRELPPGTPVKVKVID